MERILDEVNGPGYRGRAPRSTAPSRWAIAAVLASQFAVVAVLVSRHEFWRDEIRPLTLVSECHSLSDVFHALHNEGHPMVWYVLLYAALKLGGSYLVLPVMSVTIASLASFVFLRWAPFKLWQRVLFVFGHLPIYEYSVVARSYGCVMLLLFLVAVAYPQRFERPVRYGLVLALAANTSGYALPVVLAALAALAWELVVTKRGAWRRAEGKAAMKSTAVVLAGVIFAIVTTFPDRNSIVTGLHQVGLSDILRALWHLVREPGQLLGSTLGTRQPLVTSVALLVLAACLLGDGPVVAFFIVGAVGMSLMFDLVYASSEHRHRGIFLIFALVLLWIRFASGSPRCTHFAVLPAAALPAFVTLLFLDQLGVGAVAVADDYVHEMSSCRALGQFLRSTPELKGAIILGEPDYLLEALPYYADNDIYIPREGRFGKRVLYTTASKADMSLHELLEAGRSLKKRFGRPVLIALGSRLALSPDPPFERHYSYNKVLSFSRETYDEFFGAVSALTVLIRAPDGDENFAIYGLD